MKIVIWIVTLFVLQMVNILIGAVLGVQLGQVIIMILWFWLAKKLCYKWSLRQLNNQAESLGMGVTEFVFKKMPTDVLHQCEEYRGKEELLKRYLKDLVKSRKIESYEKDFLMKQYMSNDSPVILERDEPEPSNTPEKMDTVKEEIANEIQENSSNKISYCRKCGAKLDENARFCRKCGTEIIESSN